MTSRPTTQSYRLSIRIDGPNGRIGPGKIELLRLIGVHASIRAAAGSIGMSYPKAMRLLDELGRIAGGPVVASRHGGADRGGTEITPRGALLLEIYDRICGSASDATADNLAAIAALSTSVKA
ncbi:MAG: LysR family transcriptional regulator [Alphaproteobacteria bacterium]|nr:LysR family transcriptional regulator [Alphaproteobacteria bacterium]